VNKLLDGWDRNREDAVHHWDGPLNAPIEYRWKQPVKIGGVRIVCDSNLNNEKRQPCSYPQKGDRCLVPETILKAFRIEVARDGTWVTAFEESNNYQRLIRIPLGISTDAIRLIPLATWGSPQARLFSFEPVEEFETKIPAVPDGPLFADLVAKLPASDLAPPDSGLEEIEEKRSQESA
jgi:hypothetical protein